jgi:nitrite reductase/ring-hydroxylating ferredoxin subunit
MENRTAIVTPEAAPKLPAGYYIDTRIYTDESIFEEERRKIFAKVWNFVCHESEIPLAGSFRTVSVAGFPLVVVRQEDGGIRGFYNICRHRQAAVVRQCSGQAKGFQCFYHLWTYGIDGSLTGVTLPEGYEGSGFDKREYGLREVRVDEVAGMVFVSLSEAGESLREYLGETVEALERYMPAAGFEVFHYHHAEIKTNWKLFYENNTELYHTALHWSHRNGATWSKRGARSQPIFVANGHDYPPATGGFDRGTHGYRDIGLEERDKHVLPGLQANQSGAVHIFPDLLLVVLSTVVRLDHLIPLAPGRTLVEWRGLGVKGEPGEVREMRIKQHNQLWGFSGANLPEDIEATESQWPLMASGAVRYSIVARDGEIFSDEPLRHYYREWTRRMNRSYWDPFAEMKTGDKPGV